MGQRKLNNETLNCKKYFENEDENNFLPLLRLKGGGESSLSNGTSAWGTPTSQPSNSSNAKMTNNTPQASSESVWGQAGTKTPTTNSPPAANQLNTTPTSTQSNNGPSNTTKQQLEQLHNLREAIFSQDGWGAQYVNQDTSWDVPSSPEPTGKADGTSGSAPWKPPVNNGTELWEANLRTGGQPPPQQPQQQKVPWGHTPSNNIGGTWGEDEEAETSSTAWPAPNSNQQQWNSSAGSKKGEDWGNNTNSNWREPRVADPRQMTAEARDIRPGIRGATNTETIRLLDHIEPMRQMPSDMRGDPRGITGRLNGSATEAFWGQSSHINTQSMSHHKISGPSNNMGWDEMSSSSQNRNQPNFDDGTSLWGNPQQGSHWKDLPPAGGNMGRHTAMPGSLGMNQSRMKPDSSAWGGGRSGPWDDVGNQSVTWDEPNPWMKQKMPSNHLWENDLDWNQKPNKMHLTKDIICNSKQFRMLVDMGHKKEDVESALRAREMNLDEALDLLNAMRRTDNWGLRRDDHYEPMAVGNLKYPMGSNVPLTNFPPSNNDPSLLNGLSNTMNANNSLLSNISSAYVQKVLQGGAPHNLGNNLSVASRNMQSPPSTQQLKMLVEQIQMAVQAGFLNNQILNQPLAPQTLALLNQLLQQIKTLKQLMAQQSILSTLIVNGKPSNAYMQYSLPIAKTRQAISSIQNQISTQQTAYLKQMGEPLKPAAMLDSINALQNNFVNLGINKEPATNQQSKLNQWINKDKEGNEFSRAPGSTSKLTANAPFGMTTADGPWSTRRNVDTNWSDGTGEASNEKEAQWTAPQPSITDLVPEFEPGKPWKGNQIKSIEDDPTITPGSVVRSPLSIPTIKDSWSNNAQTSTTNTFASPSVKLQTSNNSLTDPNNTAAPDLWAAPTQPKGPPGFPSDNWYNSISNPAPWSVNQQNAGNATGSTWLLLRNLTAQIDGSTLRTLCMQHGPLMSFNLYLYQGFALAKYSTREEAKKAQTALNNCVLGNTTILAENPSDWDANNLIQQLASQQNASSGNWRGSNKPTSTDTWNTNWPTNSVNPWSATLDCNEPRGTPSNLNSYLPNDLLGGESI